MKSWDESQGKIALHKPEEITFATTYLFAAIQIEYRENEMLERFRFFLTPEECRALAAQLSSLAETVEQTSPPGTA